MSLRHAKSLNDLRLFWDHGQPTRLIVKVFSTFGNTFRLAGLNPLNVTDQQQRYFIRTHTQSVKAAPIRRWEVHNEKKNKRLSFSIRVLRGGEHKRATVDTPKSQQSTSSRGRLITGTQTSLTESVHRSTSPEAQSSGNVPAKSASRQASRDLLIRHAKRRLLKRRIKGRQPFHFISLVSWRQSERRKKAGDHLEQFSRNLWRWNRKFARLYQHQVVDTICPVFQSPLGLRLLKDDKDQAPHLWEQISATLGSSRSLLQSVWQKLILWALQHDHDRALELLCAAVRDPIGQSGSTRHVVEDAIKYLVSVYLEKEKFVSGEVINILHQLFCDFARTNKPGDSHAPLTHQKVIHLLLRNSTNYQARVLYETLAERQLNIHPHSLTHFISAFARQGRPNLAMDALRRIAGYGGYITSDIVQYSCITLLRARFNGVDWYRVQSHLVTEMLELGVRPSIPMLNAMILNAVEACDYQTAQAMFETARTHGVRRDTITYSILLKVALQTSDVTLVGKIMQMAEEDGALPRNNQLVFCLLVTILQIAQSEKTGSEISASKYKNMLQIYARFCNIRPLQELGIISEVSGETKVSDIISQPSPNLLSVMILGYILLFGQKHEIKGLYYRYQSLIAQDHHLIALTAETDHVANAFLLYLGQHKTTFTILPIILRGMLERPASTAVQFAKPTVQTWSIVLRSYFFNKQRAAGEKILEMMRARGIKPNQVTMNTIISGYAKMQDASAAVKTMQQMEAAGLQVDSYTMKGLTRIVNRDELLDALRKVAAKTTEIQKAG
ncbi:MAG: hypothetical protein L6R41_000240 [Letrouitia leprolyta]|nr:MAG: hypothetical protein L6R41_000240 [Letrouitia leprolyta]